MTIYDSEGNTYEDLAQWHLGQPQDTFAGQPGKYDPKADTFQINDTNNTQQLLGEKYSYPPSKYKGNVNSSDSPDKLQPRENFDYIQEKGESREDFDKRIGPAGVQDLENWEEYSPVQGGGMGFKIRRPAPKTSFLFGRHGETDENEENRIRGQSDIPINDDGRKDAEKLAESVADKGVQRIVASPLPRAKETADIVGGKLGVPVETHPGLMAWDIGDADGQKDTGQLNEYCQGDKQDERPPGSSESFNEFKNRIMSAVGDITGKYPEGTMIVAHNSTERTIAENLNGENYKDDGINPGDHKQFSIPHENPFSSAFQSAASAFQQGNKDEGMKQAARFGRAALTSLLGKVSETVIGPIEAAGRVINRYEQAMKALTEGKPMPDYDPASHVNDLMSVIGALGTAGGAPEGAAAANSIKVIPRDANTVGKVKTYSILRNTPEGETNVGVVSPYYQYWDKTVHIDWIENTDPNAAVNTGRAGQLNRRAHTFSSSEVRDLIREVAKEFPEAEYVEGQRISGAHYLQSNTHQRIPIPQSLRSKQQQALSNARTEQEPMFRDLKSVMQQRIKDLEGTYPQTPQEVNMIERLQRAINAPIPPEYEPVEGAFDREPAEFDDFILRSQGSKEASAAASEARKAAGEGPGYQYKKDWRLRKESEGALKDYKKAYRSRQRALKELENLANSQAK